MLRRDWLAGPAVILVLAALGDGGQAILGGIGVNTLFFVLLYGSLLFALVRFGLLAVVVGLFVAAAPAVWTMILVSGVAAFGVYTARAGQPLFGHLGQR